MKNNLKRYKLLYYVSLIITIIGMIVFCVLPDSYSVFVPGIIFAIDSILSVLFIVLSRKNSIKKVDILCPLVYLCLFFIIISLCFVINRYLIVPYVHFMYYYSFILVGHILLNIYSLLSIVKK